jgi:hypothetical protein
MTLMVIGIWVLQKAKQGRIADELIERLMGILGHMVRVKTLKVCLSWKIT